MSSGRARFALVLLAFLLYAALFIFRTSFVVAGERYFSLFDDAMISMRYARHLAQGLGAAWNPGERVEGYTNPLWMLLMAGVHLFPIPLSKTSLVIQTLAAVLLAFNLVVTRRIALAVSDGSEAVAIGAVLLTAFYLPLNNWGLQGMEVSLLVLGVSAAALLCVRCLDGGDTTASLYLLLGVSTWVRPDMAITLAAVIGFMAIADARNRWRHIGYGGAALLVGVLSQTLFRLWYFGAPFPNTYYLKMTGYPAPLRAARGLYVLAQFVWKANPLLFLVAVASAARRDPRRWLLAWLVAAQMAYSAYVGGDAWEYWGGANRYISIAIPAFFVLLADGLQAMSQMASASASREWHIGPRSERVGAAAYALLLLVGVVNVNSIYGLGALAEVLLVKPPLHTGPGDENQRDVESALALRQVTTSRATVAVTRAGTQPYFSDRPGIDLLGKADAHIAHESSRVGRDARSFIDFRPGHSKYDDAYSIGELRPDVIMQIWGSLAEADPYLRDYRRMRIGPSCAYVRLDSSNVAWSHLQECNP